MVPAMQYPIRPFATAAFALSLAAGPVAGRAAPLDLAGVWCGAGLLHEFTLEIAQQYEDIRARLIRKDKVREITGHIEGRHVRTDPQRDHTMDLLVDGNALRITDATGMLALARGQFFRRSSGPSCAG